MQNGTINRELNTLRAMFIRGTKVTPRMVHSVPAFPARLEENPPRKGFILNKEYAALAKDANVPWLRCLIACAYNFGFRRGELLNLRVSQVDSLDKSIELLPGETKNGEPRRPRCSNSCGLACAARIRTISYSPEGTVARLSIPAMTGTLSVSRPAWEKFVAAKRKNGEAYDRYVGLHLHDFRRSAIRNMTRR